MDHPKDLRIADFAYDLPEERIAKYPLAERDQSKLLIYNKGNISHGHFTDLPSLLPPGSLVVMNNTRVIQARLHFRKETGALIEVFCLEPAEPHDYVLMFQQTRRCTWHCLVGNSKKWKEGSLCRDIIVGGNRLTLSCNRGENDLIHFQWDSDTATWAEVLEACGELPIPPYLNRATEESDLRTYQTVYSKVKGSVAAPTAGLHFTDRVLHDLDARGIERAELTLHVGAGTFKPVKSERIEDHEMHSEWIYVPRSVVEALIRHNGECTAVGTTSVRTLESLYYIGLKIMANPDATEEELKVAQWEPYDPTVNFRSSERHEAMEQRAPTSLLDWPSRDRARQVKDGFQMAESRRKSAELTINSLRALLSWMDRHHVDALHTSTQIIIAPGYTYHIVQRIVTNFHQPQSTLLLLVSAFVGGDNWKDIYRYALQHDFRFLSYGDSSLLIP